MYGHYVRLRMSASGAILADHALLEKERPARRPGHSCSDGETGGAWIIRSLCKRVYRNDTKQPYSKEYREDDR